MLLELFLRRCCSDCFVIDFYISQYGVQLFVNSYVIMFNRHTYMYTPEYIYRESSPHLHIHRICNNDVLGHTNYYQSNDSENQVYLILSESPMMHSRHLL